MSTATLTSQPHGAVTTMDSPAQQAGLETRTGPAPRRARDTPIWLERLTHPSIVKQPVVLYGLPLFILLCVLSLYNLMSSEPVRSIRDGQLQEIALLMDDIYATLVNMTFIPGTAVKRGPHKIDAATISCRLDPTVLRLMELMPYVDRLETHEEGDIFQTDWLYGGEFIDYRNPYNLSEICDPVRGYLFPSMLPTMVGLTSWGSGGWNGDRTHVLLYDTALNAVRVFEGEEWVHLEDEDESREFLHHNYEDYTGIGLFNHSIERPLAVLTRDDLDWKIWFDAPTFLRRILYAYQSLAWTPWQTSNREDGWGIAVENIKELLRANGWPDVFDSNTFNADFIRAKHALATKRGPAESAHKIIDDLAGPSDNPAYGGIEGLRQIIESLDAQTIREIHDKQEHWFYIYRAQLHRWSLARQEEDLVAAKQEYERLCSDDVCVKPGEEILWELYSVEKEWNKVQRSTPPEIMCKRDLADFKDFAAPSDRYANCVAKRVRERGWLELAYNMSEEAALSSHPFSSLIPHLTLEQLVDQAIAKLEAEIKRHQERVQVMYDWVSTLPAHAKKARNALAMDMSGAVDGSKYAAEKIEWLKKQFNGGEDGKGHERLWSHFDGPEGV